MLEPTSGMSPRTPHSVRALGPLTGGLRRTAPATAPLMSGEVRGAHLCTGGFWNFQTSSQIMHWWGRILRQGRLGQSRGGPLRLCHEATLPSHTPPEPASS